MDNALRLIGIARKAGRIEVGEEPVGSAARARQAKLIVLAADAADNTLRRASHFAEAGAVRTVQSPYTKAELGMAVGRASCAMLALTDAGLAASFTEKLAAADGEKYGEDAQALSAKAAKVLQRQKEQRIHEKKLQRANAKPWAVPQKSGAERRLAEKIGPGQKPVADGGKSRKERKTPGEGTPAKAPGAPAAHRKPSESPFSKGAKGGAPAQRAGGSRTGDSGHRKAVPSHSTHKKGPGKGTNRNGGRQVT